MTTATDRRPTPLVEALNAHAAFVEQTAESHLAFSPDMRQDLRRTLGTLTIEVAKTNAAPDLLEENRRLREALTALLSTMEDTWQVDLHLLRRANPELGVALAALTDSEDRRNA